MTPDRLGDQVLKQAELMEELARKGELPLTIVTRSGDQSIDDLSPDGDATERSIE